MSAATHGGVGATTRPQKTAGSPSVPPARRPFPWRGLMTAAAPFLAVCAVGLPYYLLPTAERVRHPFHAWLRPSGYIGQSAGLLALALLLFLWLYPVRKRYRGLGFTGSVARWLEAHVFAALTLPLIAAIHAGWHFGGIIGLGFWAMMIVWLSGIVGRYLYTRIPRGRAGLELTREEIGAERDGCWSRGCADRARPGPRRAHAGGTTGEGGHGLGLAPFASSWPTTSIGAARPVA